jgi:hypothetical protein
MDKTITHTAQPVPGYQIWHEPGRNHPWRWAAEVRPRSYSKRHGQFHGGATSWEKAVVAAERHKVQVASGGNIFSAPKK